MAKNKNLRRCQYCDDKGCKTIDIINDNFVFTESGSKTIVKKFYHRDCYKKYLETRKKSLTEGEINDMMKLVDKGVEEYKYQSKIKNDFEDYIYNLYEVSCMPSYYFQRVSEILSGDYKDMKEPIGYEDLLEMFRRQAKQLNRIAEQKKEHGNGFDNVCSRGCFDLAVIVNKYDSFKKWKKSVSQLKQETENRHKDVNKIEETNAVSDFVKTIPNTKKRKKDDKNLVLSEFF